MLIPRRLDIMPYTLANNILIMYTHAYIYRQDSPKYVCTFLLSFRHILDMQYSDHDIRIL